MLFVCVSNELMIIIEVVMEKMYKVLSLPFRNKWNTFDNSWRYTKQLHVLSEINFYNFCTFLLIFRVVCVVNNEEMCQMCLNRCLKG